MKLLILLLTTNVIGGGTANSVVSYEQIKTEYTRAMMDVEKINLTTQKMNSVNVDLTYLSERESFTSEDVKEAVAVEIVVENSQYDWINDFLDSYLLNNNASWSTIGINYSMPEKNTSVDYKARLLPKYVEQFEGVMAIDVTLTNGNPEIEIPSEDKHISELITETNLGKIDSNDSKSIKELILNKNSNAKGNEFIISNITESTATVSAISGSGYTGYVNVNFSVIEQIKDLSEDLEINNLGEIDLAGESTNPIDKAKLIKKVILDKNIALTENDFDVHSIRENSAIAEAREDSKYRGSVEIKFTFKEAGDDLSKMNGELGVIKNIQKTTILNSFISKNKEYKIDINDLKVENITYSNATITSKTDKYVGELTVKFEVESYVVLSKDHNINVDHRVDAGTGFWKPTSDSKTYQSEEFHIDLSDYEKNYPTLLTHMVLSFDMTGTMVDIGDQKKEFSDPIQNIYFSDFKNVNNWNEKLVFEATSQGGGDYVRGRYYIIYRYNKSTNILTYKVKMDSYAYNGGNVTVNTAGKGTNKIRLNTVDMKFNGTN